MFTEPLPSNGDMRHSINTSEKSAAYMLRVEEYGSLLPFFCPEAGGRSFLSADSVVLQRMHPANQRHEVICLRLKSSTKGYVST
jgi:hypothetical protein